MTERPILFQDLLVRANLEGRKTETRRAGPSAKRWLKADAGDLLWARETWRPNPIKGGFRCSPDATGKIPYAMGYDYRATPGPNDVALDIGWKPSIHMPRRAARLFLELREKPWLERLQDITEASCIAEGIRARVDRTRFMDFEGDEHVTAQLAFRCGWDSINAKRSLGWDDDPEVVVLRYERVKSGNGASKRALLEDLAPEFHGNLPVNERGA